MSFTRHFMTADEVYLTVYFVPCPFTLIGMKEIDAKSGTTCRPLLCSCQSRAKRIETVSLKIHHWIYLVHNPFAKPALRVLINSKSVPPTGRITRSIPVFSNRTGTEASPKASLLLHLYIYNVQFQKYYPAAIGPAYVLSRIGGNHICRGREGILRITQIIEMYPSIS